MQTRNQLHDWAAELREIGAAAAIPDEGLLTRLQKVIEGLQAMGGKPQKPRKNEPINPEALRAKLLNLTSVAQELNEASDDCNEILGELEDSIVKTGVGVSGWLVGPRIASLSYDDYDDGKDGVESEQYWEIGFDRYDGAWRIVARQRDGSVYDEDPRIVIDEMPLLKTPRHVRLAAMGHIEALIDVLAEQADEYLKNIQSTTSVRMALRTMPKVSK